MWTADLGNGRYKNPILYADYSDPDAIRVGDDYFMISSSFSNAPAMPLLHSKDLVNWKVVNYILAEIPEFRYRNPIHGCGVWAPAIRYHEGTYYVCFPMPDTYDLDSFNLTCFIHPSHSICTVDCFC